MDNIPLFVGHIEDFNQIFSNWEKGIEKNGQEEGRTDLFRSLFDYAMDEKSVHSTIFSY